MFPVRAPAQDSLFVVPGFAHPQNQYLVGPAEFSALSFRDAQSIPIGEKTRYVDLVSDGLRGGRKVW